MNEKNRRINNLTMILMIYDIIQVKKVEQFIMSYGGLRGAVAFCLAILLPPGDCSSTSGLMDTPKCKLKGMLVTTTITVVCFTVFVQGTTIKKLVDVLGN